MHDDKEVFYEKDYLEVDDQGEKKLDHTELIEYNKQHKQVKN